MKADIGLKTTERNWIFSPDTAEEPGYPVGKLYRSWNCSSIPKTRVRFPVKYCSRDEGLHYNIFRKVRLPVKKMQ